MSAALPEGAAGRREAHVWKRDEDDFYSEAASPWIWARLFEDRRLFPQGAVLLDPACGLGTVVHEAAKARLHALGSDIVARWEDHPDGQPRGSYRVADFTAGWPPTDTPGWQHPDIIASNPPFNRAEEFVRLALGRAGSVVAMLLPSSWRCGDKRSRWLETTPLYRVLEIAPRPSMPPGRVIIAGDRPGNGTKDFAIYVWLRGYGGRPEIGWLRRDAA